MTLLADMLLPPMRVVDMAHDGHLAPIWSVLAEVEADGLRNERRFDGPYGRLYDGVVTNGRVRALTRRIAGSDVVMGRLDELASLAYDHAADEPLLDVPCGALSSIELSGSSHRTGIVVGADLSHAMLAAAAARRASHETDYPVELIRCDAVALPFRTGCFATALSTNGLHCMTEPERMLGEVARVLRPGGLLVLSTLVDGHSRGSRMLNGAARRTGVIPSDPPTRQQLDAMLADAGFSGTISLGGRDLVALCTRRG